MKQLYSGALTVLTLTFFSLTSSAQTGGTYTAVQPGNWHTPTGPGIWATVEPPQNCPNCVINLNVNGTITLNTTITLSNKSVVNLGGTGNTAILLIGNSNASGFATSFSIIMANDGTNSLLNLVNNNALIDARTAGTYDGILTSFPGTGGSTSLFKQIGNAPSGFVDNTVASNGNAPGGNLLGGPSTLSSSGTLPIILADFNAAVDNGSVNLAWTTDLEVNSDHFTVQASTNAGESWANVGTVAAAGSSASPINYSFTDSRAAQGTSEYRLEMVDRDGRASFSPVKAVRIGLISAVSVYPNPASDFVNVTVTGEAAVNANIRLINLAGQVLLEKTVANAGGTTVPIAVSSYPAGNYLIVVTGSDGSKQISKVLIAK